MNDYLFVNPFLHPPGGGEGVANWMIQVLASRGEVTVLTWTPPDFAEIDAYYGTTLQNHPNVRYLNAAPLLRPLFERLGVPHELLKTGLLLQRARRLRKKFRYCFSCYDEMDLGPPAVQYVHYPRMLFTFLKKSEPCPWPGALWARLLWPVYVRMAYYLSRSEIENIRRNVTITNSNWTAEQYRKRIQGTVERVIYPPPLGDADCRPESEREPAFLTIGRVEPSKDWLTLISLIERVRARGHEVKLTLAGNRFDDDFLSLLQDTLKGKEEWVSLLLDLPRDELDASIGRHAFGLHGKSEEPYGMAVAELVLGGCLTFVPDSGGQVEIVGVGDLCFSDVDDAVDKICNVLSDRHLRKRLAAELATQTEQITRQAFVGGFDQFLDDLENGCVPEGRPI